MTTENEPGYRGIRKSGCRTSGHQGSRQDCRVWTWYPDNLIRQACRTTWCPGSLVSAVLCLLSLAGCARPQVKESPATKIEQLTQENTHLIEQVEKLTSQNKELESRIQVLSGLPENVRLESLNRLERIKIGRYTGFFDKNNGGKKETLIVYIEPIDEQGDVIKAPGAAEVQLWDLNKPESKAMLGQWKTGPDELKKLWFSTIVSSYYRLTFDVAGIIDNLQDPLTVRVTFTDYLAGRVFTDQKVIEAP
jgi:outer membrane murein-binding lipoprotein Lpp